MADREQDRPLEEALVEELVIENLAITPSHPEALDAAAEYAREVTRERPGKPNG